ncbi:MAG: MoaD/ThiS family protein [Candidatus Aerophobetes bacterium]|nr:MoaD/ThiS family protein [Candidatus Aerophobetes bacterium]
MRIKVKFSTVFRGLNGVDKTELFLYQDATVKDALEKIVEGFPKLKKWIPQNGKVSNYIYASVNGKFPGSETQLKNDDEIALFPVPIGGG